MPRATRMKSREARYARQWPMAGMKRSPSSAFLHGDLSFHAAAQLSYATLCVWTVRESRCHMLRIICELHGSSQICPLGFTQRPNGECKSCDTQLPSFTSTFLVVQRSRIETDVRMGNALTFRCLVSASSCRDVSNSFVSYSFSQRTRKDSYSATCKCW